VYRWRNWLDSVITCNRLFNSLAVDLIQWRSSGDGIVLTDPGGYRAPPSSLLQAHHTQPTNATKTKENMPRVSIKQFLCMRIAGVAFKGQQHFAYARRFQSASNRVFPARSPPRRNPGTPRGTPGASSSAGTRCQTSPAPPTAPRGIPGAPCSH